jgi:hypothetical protein
VSVEQFKLIKVDGNPKPGGPAPKQIRNRNDEELEAARDDVRIFVFFMDDYHTRRGNSMSVRFPLIRFIQQQLRPTDMIGLMYPLQPVSDLQLTRNHEAIVNAINTFEGRKFDYHAAQHRRAELRAVFDRPGRAHSQRRGDGRLAGPGGPTRVAARGTQVDRVRQRGLHRNAPTADAAHGRLAARESDRDSVRSAGPGFDARDY